MDQRTTTTVALVAGVAAAVGVTALVLSRRQTLAVDAKPADSCSTSSDTTGELATIDGPAEVTQPDDEDAVMLAGQQQNNVTKRRRSRGSKKNKNKKAAAAAAATSPETSSGEEETVAPASAPASAHASATDTATDTVTEIATPETEEDRPADEFDMTPINETIKELTTHASTAFEQKDYTSAVGYYTQAIATLPAAPTKASNSLSNAMTEALFARKVLLCNRACVYEQRGDLAQALQDCNLALQFDPFYSTALLRRARICYALRNPRQTAADLTRIINLSQTYENYVDEKTAIQCSNELDAVLNALAKKEAEVLLKAKQKERHGIEALPAIAVIMPFYYSYAGERENFVADASEMEARAEKLVKELEEATAGDGEEGDALRAPMVVRMELAFVRKYQKRLRESALLFQEIVDELESEDDADADAEQAGEDAVPSTSSASPLSQEQMARCFEELSSTYHLCTNVTRAEELIERSMALNPKRVTSIIMAAEVQLELEHKELSVALLARAYEVLEAETARLAELGDKATEQEKQEHINDTANYHFHKATFTLFEGASGVPGQSAAAGLPDMLLAIEACPSFAVAYMYAGVSYYHAGEKEKSIASLEKSCELAPELFQTHTYLGEIYMELQRFDDADAKYNDAIEVDPLSAMAYVNKGVIKTLLFQQTEGKDTKLFAEALRLFNQAVQVDPTCGVALLRTAVLYSFVGKSNLALKKLEQAVGLAKNKSEMEEFCLFRASCQAQILATQLGYQPSPSSAQRLK